MSRYESILYGNSYFSSPERSVLRKNIISLPSITEKHKKLEIKQHLPLKNLDNSTKSLEFSVFHIYGLGINYNSSSGYGLPIGTAILITENLILTTHTNILSEHHALFSILKLISNENIQFKIVPRTFFFTSSHKNITIVSISPIESQNLKSTTKKIEISHKFQLYKESYIKILGFSTNFKVTDVFSNYFVFRCSENILSGTPIFSPSYKFQGIYLSSLNSRPLKQAIRCDSLFEQLLSIRSLYLNPDLQSLFGGFSSSYFSQNSSNRLSNSGSIYWVQPKSKNIFYYSLITSSWNSLEIVNFSEFTDQFLFKPNSRTAVIGDGSLFICGGIDLSNPHKSVSEVFQYFPVSGVIQKKKSMQEPRNGHCVVYRHGSVYVIGGSLRVKTCEKYDFIQNKWEPIANLINCRYNSSAVLYFKDSYIIVVGGEGNSKNSVERYSFLYDKWEILPLEFNWEFISPGIVTVESNKIVIFGGELCGFVVIVEQDEYIREINGGNIEETFRVYQADVLNQKIVSHCEGNILWAKNLVCFVNEIGNERPDVFKYSLKNIKITDPKEIKYVSKAGKNILYSNRLLTPEFHDVYY